MNRQTSPRFVLLLGGAVTGLVAAVVTGRADLAALVSPAVLWVVAGVAIHRWPDPEITLTGPDRAVEGDRVDLVVTVRSAIEIPWLELRVDLPDDVEPAAGMDTAIITVPAGTAVAVRFPVEVTRWGVSVVGRVRTTARDRFGLFATSAVHPATAAVRVHPGDGNRRSVVAPAEVRSRVGVHQSRHHGEGSEFAEVRPFRIGDRARAINWRVTARKGEPWVTVRHPDRSADLVFVLDSFTDLGPEGDSLVQRAVRAVMSMTEAGLVGHDRVGVLDVGRRLRWYRPRLGRLHRAQLFDALLETQVDPAFRRPDLDRLPLHDLSDGTLVVVVSGLLADDAASIPTALRLRGHDVAVLEPVADDHLSSDETTADALAARLWAVARARRRAGLIDHGVPVIQWRADQPLELAAAALAGRTRR